MESIRELRQICQEPVIKGNCWYARNVARRLSIHVTRVLLGTRTSANQITFLLIPIGIIAGSFFMIGARWSLLLGALALQVSYVLDHVDGEIARYRKQAGLTGVYLDYIVHCIVHPIIFAAMAWGVYQGLQRPSVLILGFLASLFVLVFDLVHWYGQSTVLHRGLMTYLDSRPGSRDRKPDGAGGSAGSNSFEASHAAVQFFWRAFSRVLFLWHYPSIMNVICVVALLNLTYPTLRWGSQEVPLMYTVILFYGVTLPLLSALLLTKQVLLRNTDQHFDALIETIETGFSEDNTHDQ